MFDTFKKYLGTLRDASDDTIIEARRQAVETYFPLLSFLLSDVILIVSNQGLVGIID
jgi:hypothetical protein